MSFNVTIARARRYLNTHVEQRFGANKTADVEAYLRRLGETHSAVIVAMLEHYETRVGAGEIPMMSKPEWSARLGISKHTFRDHWERLRRWTIDGQHVFVEGKHALRKGAWIDDAPGGARQITLPGVGLRTADMPPMTLRASLAVVDSTRESARVFSATVHHAAQNVELDASAPAEEKARARDGRIATINPAGQLPLRVLTGTGGK